MNTFYQADGILYLLTIGSLLSCLLFLVLRTGADNSKPVLWFVPVLLLALVTGLRPVSGKYIDMTVYASMYELAAAGAIPFKMGDPFFDLYSNAMAVIFPLWCYILLSSIIYFLSRAWGTHNLFPANWPIAFFSGAASFSFYSFATNGIRNGIATSLLFLALSMSSRFWKAIVSLAAILTHLSVALPAAAYLLARKCQSIKPLLLFWFATIPLSLLSGSLFPFLGSIELDQRTEYFRALSPAQIELEAGYYRWDFLIYSFAGVASVAFWTLYKGFDDVRYRTLAGCYLLTNGVWVIVNQVPQSNRFAYLSWFLMEVVILYPILMRPIGRRATLPVLSVVATNVALAFYVI